MVQWWGAAWKKVGKALGRRPWISLALLGMLIGAVGGAAAAILTLACSLAMRLFSSFPWLSWLLPLAGLLTVGLYHVLGISWRATTNTVINAARHDELVRGGLAPAILGGTFLTLLGGGSVGKEAAALQLGGSLGSVLSERGLRWLGRDVPLSRGLAVRCGMAGAFASLLGAPLAATFFVIEVTRVRPRLRTSPFVLLAAVAGALVAEVSPVGSPWVPLAPAIPTSADIGASMLVTLGCALAAVVFCRSLQLLRGLPWGPLEAPWAHILFGGVLISLLVSVVGLGPYAGTGENFMEAALAGKAAPWDFFLKGLLTVVVLGVGYKGGEIMPIMAIGSTLGCAVGLAGGADPIACAGIGLVAMFSACTNSPISATLLGIEAFGPVAWPAYVLAAFTAYLLTARTGLYPSNCAPSYHALLESWGAVVDAGLSRLKKVVAELRK